MADIMTEAVNRLSWLNGINMDPDQQAAVRNLIETERQSALDQAAALAEHAGQAELAQRILALGQGSITSR